MFTKKVMAWVGILNREIIGPYFFESARVTGAVYERMLREFLIPELIRRAIDPYDVIYMHDGAPSHITLPVRHLLTSNFAAFIGRGAGALIGWPPRSPDLNPLDFFLWSFVKAQIFKRTTKTVQGLKYKIEEALDMITEEMLGNVQNHIDKRYSLCIELSGKIVEPRLR